MAIASGEVKGYTDPRHTIELTKAVDESDTITIDESTDGDYSVYVVTVE